MNRSLKIFVACALGGGIGAFVALQLNSFFWWLGLIAGGFAGYITYDFGEVISAIHKAWKKAAGQIPKSEGIAVFLFAVSMLSCFGTAWLIASLFYLWGGITEKMAENVIILPAMVFMMVCVIISFARLIRQEGLARESKNGAIFFRKMALRSSPPMIFFYYPGWIIFAAFKHGIPFGWKFGKLVFVLIHSEIRLLCMLDAAIGAGVGYYFGSALIGALAGGLLGVFNFQIISKRVLKLVPVKK